MHAVGVFRVGLYRDHFQQVLHPAGFQLQPGDRSPVVWRFEDPRRGLQGRVLNVLGLLGGGVMSIAATGWAYVAQRGGATLALYLPTAPKTVLLPVQGLKELQQAQTHKPLYPPAWPAAAIARIVRHRLRTIAILDEAWLLGQCAEQAPAAAPPTAALP